MSVQNAIFRCEFLFHYSSEMNDNDGIFYLVLVTCSPNESVFKPHEKQSNDQSWKRRLCALSKLVYFKTQLLKLVESFMEVPKYRHRNSI